MRTSTDSSSASRPDSALGSAERVLADLLSGAAGAAADLIEAGGEARSVAAAAGPADAARIATAVFLSEVLVRCAARGETLPRRHELIEPIATALDSDPRTLALDTAARAFAHPRLMRLAPACVVAAMLELLWALAPVEHVALTPESRDTESVTVSIPGCADAVLVAEPCLGESEACEVFLRSASATLAPALDALDDILRQRPAAELLADAAERRTARIGFDLHDTAIQTLAALLADTRLFETQLTPILGEENPIIAGRVDDLKSRMVVLEFELRSLCQSLEAPVVLQRPLERVIEQEIVAFKRSACIELTAEVSGDFETLTPSQRITLLRVVQEALRNVGEHSEARKATLRITAGPDGSAAEITDDGDGFDVEAAFARAVADGRVGLLGMMERARLLGGRGEVISGAGEGTKVSVHLPHWTA